jgi:hypothetical protein
MREMQEESVRKKTFFYCIILNVLRTEKKNNLQRDSAESWRVAFEATESS